MYEEKHQELGRPYWFLSMVKDMIWYADIEARMGKP